jgi:hypothetical protein
VRISPTRMHTIQKLIAILGFMLLIPMAFASITDVYLAQNAQGAGDGSSCSNAKAASFFNTSGNWGSGSSQIGAGTTVHLCGTLTASAGATLLTFQGSGGAGNPVTLLFENGTVLQSPYFQQIGGAINLNGKSHILIDGGTTCGEVNTTLVPCNGLIQNTSNGSTGNENCINSPCANQQNSSAVYSTGTFTDVEVRNLAIKHMYHRTDLHSNSGPADGSVTFEIWFDHIGGSSNVNIHNNDIENGSECVTVDFEGGGSIDSVTVDNVYCNDMHWGIAIVNGGVNNTHGTHIHVDYNEITNWANWVSPSTTFHGNGTILYNAACSGCDIGDTSSTISNNYIHGDLNNGFKLGSPTAFLSVQDNAVGFMMFNNRLVNTCNGQTGGCGVALWWVGCGPACGGGGSIYNNVFNTPNMAAIEFNTKTPNVVKNNVMANSAAGIEIEPNDWSQVASDYNDAYNISGSGTGGANWVCVNVGGQGNCITFSQYQSQHSQDSHSTTGDPKLDANDRLQSGSAAIGLATNLTNLGMHTLDVDLADVARPPSGSWDAAAYQYGSSGGPPPPPVGLAVVVH